MNLMKILFLISVSLIVNAPLNGQDKSRESEEQQSAEIELIRETLTDYIEGSTNGQPDRLRNAFHADLNLYSIKNGAVSAWSGKDYIKDTKEGKPTGETGKIMSIDFENDTAVAKIEISHPNSKQPYVDYFMLLKVKDRWTIIHKMFTKKTSVSMGKAKEVTNQTLSVATPKSEPSLEELSAKLVDTFEQNVSQETEQEIDELFAEYSASNSPGVAISVMHKGEVVFKKGYGNANLEHQIPIDPDASIFNAGSASKQVTAFALLLLTEQGKLSLDDDVHKYIPELNEYGQKVSLRQLAHHTGGIRSDLSLLAMAGWSPGDSIDRDDVLQMIYRQRELNFEPGEEFDYSNAGYDLLAEVVSRVSGQSFAEFCKKQIFQPLEMDNSFFVSSRFNLIPNLASPYGSTQSRRWRLSPNDSYSGSTGLFTTAADFSKWAMNFRNAKVGNEATLKQMVTLGILNNGKTFGYSFGLFTEEYKGLEYIQHGGASSGYRSFIGRFPDQDFATVVFGNSSSIDPRSKSLALADIFLQQYFKSAESVDRPDVEDLSAISLERFVGNYWNNKDRAVRIHINDGRLNFSIGGGPSIELASIGETEFEMLGVGVRSHVQFRKTDEDTLTMHVVGDGTEEETYQTYVPKQYTPEEMKQFVGTFYSEELDAKYLVEIDNGSLTVGHLRFAANTLVPVVKDLFSNTGWRFTTLKFERGGNSKINGFRVTSMRCRNIHFKKLASNLLPSQRKSLARSTLNVVHDAGIEQGLEHFENFKKSSEYFIRESEINDVGYALLGQEQVEAAIEVFKLNVSLFPSSWNVFDSLGEAYAKNGATRLAIESYEKSIQRNPDHTAGIEVLQKLRQQPADDSSGAAKKSEAKEFDTVR